MRPFSFVQLSDTHVGSGPPLNPGGTAAFERAVEVVNRLPEPPDLVLFTGDLTHDSEDPAEAARLGANGRRIVEEKYNWGREETVLLDAFRLLGGR